MDLLALALDVVFEGSLVLVGALLLLSYAAFARMNPDVRRARMFLMADRVRRFLGAFTIGFLLIAAAVVLVIAGLPDATFVLIVVIVLFLVAVVYGSLELFFIVRPRRGPVALSLRRASMRSANGPSEAASNESSAGGDGHAAR